MTIDMTETVDGREGAKIRGGIPDEGAGVRRLEDVVLLDVRGDDTRSWLNGQLTNDVRHTKKGDAVYALAVTVKGKILADVWVFDRGDDRFWLAVPSSSVEALLESFDGQIIMEDVEVAPEEGRSLLTVVGPRADVVTAAIGDETPVFSTERLGPSRDVVVAADDTATFERLVREAGALGGGAIDESAWELARLRRHTPRFAVDFDARNYPQEAGLKDRAVSFQKGCYLGQEVVCMLESRGKVSKRLVALRLGGSAPPADSEISAEGKGVGRITSSVLDGGEALALGYVKAAFAEVGAKLEVGGASAEVTAIVE